MDCALDQSQLGCLECGAPRLNGWTCWDQLGALIAWEGDDPDLRTEHFLTVASYNLQHPSQFTSEALEWLRAGFVEYLDSGLAVPQLRQHAARTFAGSQRVLRPAAERVPTLRQWRMNIADVYLPDQPTGAAERVRGWAAAIRAELR